MPTLTINSKDFHGGTAQGVVLTVELVRDNSASGGTSKAVYGPDGWYVGRKTSIRTNATGTATIDLPATIAFSVQTRYRISSGGPAAEFTMPDEPASLTDRLLAEDVEVDPTIGGLTEAQARGIVREIVEDSAEVAHPDAQVAERRIPDTIARTEDQTGTAMARRLETLQGADRLAYGAVVGGPPTGAEANVGVPFEQADRTKLDGIAAGATVALTGAQIVALLTALMGSARLAYSALLGTPNLSAFVVNGEINGGILTLTQEGGEVIALTLPTTTQMADGVVVSGTLDAPTKTVNLTTSTGATVALNLSALARLNEIEPWARGIGAIPSADLDDPFPREFVELEDVGPGVLGQPGQGPVVNDDRTELVWGDAVVGGAAPLRLVGSADFDFSTAATGPGPSIPTGIFPDDSQLFCLHFGGSPQPGVYSPGTIFFLGSEWRSLGVGNNDFIVGGVVFQGFSVINLYRTTDGQLSLALTLPVGDDPGVDVMPLSLYAVQTGGATTFEMLTNTPDTLGAALSVWRTNAARDGLETVAPTDVGIQDAGITAISHRETEPWARPGGGQIPEDRLPTTNRGVVGEEVMNTTFTRIDTTTSRGLAADFILPETGRYLLHMYTASEAGTMNSETTEFDAAVVRALDPISVSGTPPQSTTVLTRANSIDVRVQANLRGNQAVSVALSRDENNRLLLRPLHTSFPAAPLIVLVMRVAANAVGGSGDSDTGGGATGQTGSDAANPFDIITGPTIVRTFTSVSLTPAADGSLVQAQFFGGNSPANVPIISTGNVLRLRITAGTVSGPPMDLFMVLGDGSFLTLGVQFPRSGETIDIEVGTTASNGTTWTLGYSFSGFDPVVITGGTITATVLRYHERFATLTPFSPLASELAAGWRYDFPFSLDTSAIDTIVVRMANTNDNFSEYFQHLPTGSGDVDLIKTHPEDSPPTNPFGDDVYAMLHQPGNPPIILLKTRAYTTSSYLTFVFLRNPTGAIVGVQGIGSTAGGIAFNQNVDDIRFQFFAIRRS